jgi:hypothetical protein
MDTNLTKSQHIEEIIVLSRSMLTNVLRKYLEKQQNKNKHAEIHQVLQIDDKQFIVIYNTYN